MQIDSATWAAAVFVVTVIGLVGSLLLWRRRGPASGLRGLAWTLVPVALWLTRTLRLVVDILDAIVRWTTHLVFSPVVWLGLLVAALAALLFVVSGAMRARGLGVRRRGVPLERPRPRGAPAEKAAAPGDDLADIQAILDRRGIK